MDSNLRIKLSLYLNYIVFAILLNSVGIVILKSISNFQVNEVDASTLELFKDLSIAIVSFLVASYLPKIGYKNSMLAGLLLVCIACLVMYFGNSFNAARCLFALVGISFALIKVSVYSMVGLVTKDAKEHGEFMSSIEGVFMFGVASAYFIFPFFNNSDSERSWLNVYLFLFVLSLASFLFLYFTKIDKVEVVEGSDFSKSFKDMMGMLAYTLVIVFIFSAFLSVMVEQGIMTWLPTFNKNVLHLPENISIMVSSILSVSIGVGRIVAGKLSRKISWHILLITCLICAMLLVVFVLPKVLNVPETNVQSFSDIPLIAFIFPLIGLFLAPIYPLLNSTVLSALPKNKHSAMTGLIVIFSALGGTLGSRVIGYLFKNYSPNKAFYFTLIPMVLLIIAIYLLNKETKKQAISL